MKIHGKEYVEVKDRVLEFHKRFPNGFITTEILKNEGNFVLIRASVFPDAATLSRVFTGHAQEDKSDGHVNATSHIENCETSAVGRALGLMGIGIDVSIASGNEVQRAVERQEIKKQIEDPKINNGTTKMPRTKVEDLTLLQVRNFEMLVDKYRGITIEQIATQETEAGIGKGLEYLEYFVDLKANTAAGIMCQQVVRRYLEEIVYANQ